MTIDLILASVHHLAVFALLGLLVAEWVLVRPGLDAAALQRVGRVDAAYGGVAVLVLVAGFARVFFGLKGSAYYLGNPMFWTKLGLFVAIGLVSIVPTLRFVAWRRALKQQQGALPDAAAILGTRRLIGWQLGAFALLPVVAAALARGVGL